ncbi:MAG: DNA-binding protein [Desulfobacteraceae bacterium]|nr:MAG: DNA-binding protein [Desulfobacteraceae bacterium]
MKYSEARSGRVFILRLEDGDILHESVETFAREQGVRAASAIVLGGADEGSKLVVGPEDSRGSPVVPLEHLLHGVHEVAGVGTLFPDQTGKSVLHMHIAGGRRDSAVAGCIRRGVRVWKVMEIVLLELLGTSAFRKMDPTTGFEMLEP